MRLYIENYNINNILKKQQKLEKYLIKKISFIEIYSEEGIYLINDKNTFKITINDVSSIKLPKYINDLDFILDKSTIQKIESHHIPSHHMVIKNDEYV